MICLNVRFCLLIPGMNKSRKIMEWLIFISIVSLMLGILLFKKFKKTNESCSLPNAARMLSTYRKLKYRFVKIIII